MAYKIKLGTFSKLENSTAQPTTATWAEYDIVLKNGCDISNPDILISIDYATAAGYNYAYFLNRYYWIVGRNMIRENLCAISLKVDPMATYKTQIGAAPLYILRASAAANGNIKDNFYPMTAQCTKYHQVQTTGIPGGFNTGVYIVNVAGTTTAGATTLFQLSPTEFKKLINNLYSYIDGFQLSDVIASIVKSFGGNPQTLINSAMWFPSAFSSDTLGPVVIGSWTSGAVGIPLADATYQFSDYSYTLYKHPQAATRGNYLNLAPYTNYIIGLPGVGTIPLDTTKLEAETSVTVKRSMDAVTGQLIVDIVAPNSGLILAHVKGQIGIPISLKGSGEQSIVNSGISSLATAAVAAATGSIPAIAGAVSAGIGTILDAVGGTPVNTGMGSGAADIQNRAGWLDTIHYTVTDADNAEHGRPLCEVHTPSSLTGFMVVSEGYVAIPGPLPEQQEVRRLLEAGFFYE